jgi:hypothetical protein
VRLERCIARRRTFGRLGPGDLVSYRRPNYDGWKAFAHGRPEPVSADGMGFILIHPECEGDCEIDLRWTGPGDLWLAAFVSLAPLCLLLVADARLACQKLTN